MNLKTETYQEVESMTTRYHGDNGRIVARVIQDFYGPLTTMYFYDIWDNERNEFVETSKAEFDEFLASQQVIGE